MSARSRFPSRRPATAGSRLPSRRIPISCRRATTCSSQSTTEEFRPRPSGSKFRDPAAGWGQPEASRALTVANEFLICWRKQMFKPQAWCRLALAMAATGAVAAATACSTSNAAITRLYAYPDNPLFAAAALLADNGHKAQAAELKAIADTPSGLWVAGQPGEMREVRQVTQAANRANAIP